MYFEAYLINRLRCKFGKNGYYYPIITFVTHCINFINHRFLRFRDYDFQILTTIWAYDLFLYHLFSIHVAKINIFPDRKAP